MRLIPSPGSPGESACLIGHVPPSYILEWDRDKEPKVIGGRLTAGSQGPDRSTSVASRAVLERDLYALWIHIRSTGSTRGVLV